MTDAGLLEEYLAYSEKENAKKTAEMLLAAFGDLYGVLSASPPELLSHGVTEQTAVLLGLVIPVLVRAAETALPANAVCDTAEKLGDYLARRFVCANAECAYLLLLDGSDRVLSVEKLSDGVVNTTAIDPRKIVETALFRGAASAVLAHNHPSGNLIPSREDELTTSLVADALDTVGIPLAEHFIVTGRRFLPLLLYSETLNCRRPDGFYGKQMIDETLSLREERRHRE